MLKPAHVLPLLLVVQLLAMRPGWGNDQRQVLSFAEQLYAEHDYYRAITEYKRFLHLAPDAPEAPRAALRIGESLLAGERWEDAEKALQRVLSSYPHSAAAERAGLLLPEIAYRQQRYSLASEQFRQLAETATTPQARAQARYRLAWSEIEQRNFAAAIEELNRLDSPQADRLAAALAGRQPIAGKSPLLAGSLSGLLPGAGQLYTGNPRDAGLAFALNAAFIWAAVEAFDHDNEALGGILCFFEIGWYGGNIYNAVNLAHRSNQRRYDAEKHELQMRHGIQLKLGLETGLVELYGQF